MKLSKKKKYLIMGISLLAVVVLIPLFLLTLKERSVDHRMVTGDREELKSVTIRLCDQEGNAEKDIIITDSVHMDSVYDLLHSTDTVVKKKKPQTENQIKILLTYAYAYDHHSGEEDVVFWDTESYFYRCEDHRHLLEKNVELCDLLTGLLENVALELVSEEQRLPQKITLRQYEGSKVISAVSLEDGQIIRMMFSDLKAIETKAILYPSELSALALDTEYELTLEYDDQDDIVIFSGTETPETFYRYTNTVSSDGEKGYVFGGSDALYQLITALFEKTVA